MLRAFDAPRGLNGAATGALSPEHLSVLPRSACMDPYILRSYVAPLRADLAIQTGRVRQLRKRVVDLERIGKNASADRARLQDAEETLAHYAAELARLERELTASAKPE